MFLELRDFLTFDDVARLNRLADEMSFSDGKQSNPHNITKLNLQVDRHDPHYAESVRIVAAAFQRSRAFRDFAFPKAIAPPLLSRYAAGMKYGPHADTAFMAFDQKSGTSVFRSDLSCTVFLSDPGTYEGGELVLHLGTRPVPIKGLPGEAFVYPSTLLHEVRPVVSGVRLVSLAFIESLIPDERERNMLFEIQDILSLEGTKMDWSNRVRLEVVSQNLMRMWSRSQG